MSNDEIEKQIGVKEGLKKRLILSTRVNFSNPWPGSWD